VRPELGICVSDFLGDFLIIFGGGTAGGALIGGCGMGGSGNRGKRTGPDNG
jgi:hypothetical protein